MTLQTTHPVDTTPIHADERDRDLDPIWRAIVTESRTRANDIHLPISFAFAERLCDATFADRVFFANSGAEAVECAIKAAT